MELQNLFGHRNQNLLGHRKPARPGGALLLAATVAVVASLAVGVTSPALAQPIQTYAQSPQATAQSPQATGMVRRVFRDADGDHKYVLFIPRNYYSLNRKSPAILYLHGAGERGTDGLAQTTVGLGPFVQARSATFPFLVVFPQCEETHGRILTSWSADSPDGKRALAIFDAVSREFAVDANRRILTGWSMGGYGTWSLGAADPKRWSALVPVAGAGDPTLAPRLVNVPTWAFAGAQDTLVPVQEVRRLVDAIKTAGGHPLYTEIPGAGHDLWKTVYNDDRLYQWMLSPSSTPAVAAPSGTTALDAGPLRARSRSGSFPAGSFPGGPYPGMRPPAADVDAPFVPAVAIPNAIAVRLGNDALKALAHSAPALIPQEAFTGGINDIFTSTEASGYTFSVQFSRIGYSFQMARAYVKAYAPGLVNIQLALRNINLTIGSTYVQGSGRSAVAGPISIQAGYRYPIWLSFDVTPYVENGRLRLQLAGSRFEIPNDNWTVSPPYGVSTSGLGMTEERVRSGLMQGIYGQKSRIEQEASAIVPTLLARMEQRLDLPEVTEAANAFWPLPVYRPRLKAWPQSVRVDEQGISLVMGVTAAAVDPREAPAAMHVERPAGVAIDSIPRDTQLELGVAPNILAPLTRMLIEEDVARVNVLDIPVKSFAAFADRNVLGEIFPDLAAAAPGTEVSAELILASPITVRDAKSESTNGAEAASRLAEQTNKVTKTTVLKPNAKAAEIPAAGAAPGKSASGPALDGDPLKKGSGARTAELAGPKSTVNGSPNGSESAKRERPFEFVIPKAVIAIFVKDNAQETKWKPYAEIDFELTQQAAAAMVRNGYSQRGVRLDWTGEPVVKAAARFASGVTPKNSEIRTEKLHDLFLAAWKGWTQNSPASQIPVADVDFHYSKLRMDGISWSPPVFAIRFGNPGVKLTNSSSVDLVYETKGPYSDWSEPITLKQGKSQEFDVADPLLFRRRSGEDFVQMYTLPVGSHCEFRTVTAGGAPNLYQVRPPAPPAEGR